MRSKQKEGGEVRVMNRRMRGVTSFWLAGGLCLLLQAACGSANLTGNENTNGEISTGVNADDVKNWAPDVYYSVGDVVSYQGKLYRCIQAHTSLWVWTPDIVPALFQLIGNAPEPSPTPEPTPDPTPTPNPAQCYASWEASAVYTGGATVSEQGVNYQANWWTQGEAPSTHNGPAGSGQPWTSLGSCSSSPPPNPDPTPTPNPPPAGFIFSPYKDITISMNWNTNVISTAVTGSLQPVLSVMPSKLNALTWAFATGECGSENWGGLRAEAVAAANLQSTVSAGKRYIISTGGAAGSFTCGTDEGFATFIKRYYTANMLGVDFDIEAGQNQSAIDNLVQRVKVAQRSYPGLRFSFTLATLGGNAAQSLGATGVAVMNSIKAAGLDGYTINLMVMDYGSPTPSVCTVGGDGQCDMAQSAIQAAKNLHEYWGVPYGQIELTPMIGGNDTQGETFTLANVATMTAFAVQNQMAGIHFWSFDRDRDCAPGWASPTCNSYGQAGTLGFTNAFISSLGL